MEKEDALYEQFESLITQLDPLSVIYFAVVTLFIRGNIEEVYGDLEFIIANACSTSKIENRKKCTPEDFEELIILSQQIKLKQLSDTVIDFKGPVGETN